MLFFLDFFCLRFTLVAIVLKLLLIFLFCKATYIPIIWKKSLNQEFIPESILIVADVFLLVHFRLSFQLLLFGFQVLKIAIFCYKNTQAQQTLPEF